MMLAGLPVPNGALDALAALVRAAGADDLADRLDVALAEGVALLALAIDERATILAALEDPPDGLAELRAVLLADHTWTRPQRFAVTSPLLNRVVPPRRLAGVVCANRCEIANKPPRNHSSR